MAASRPPDLHPQYIPPDFQKSWRSRLTVWRDITLPPFMLVILLLVLRVLGSLHPLENYAYDQLLRHRPLESPDARITLVGITDEDKRSLDHYPIYDSELNQLLKTLDQAGARVIGLDLFRDVPVNPGHQKLRQTYRSLPNLIAVDVLDETDPTPLVAPPPTLPKTQIGFANLIDDEDWILRRMPLTLRQPGYPQPRQSFALRMAATYLAQEGYQLKIGPGAGTGADDPGAGPGTGQGVSFEIPSTGLTAPTGSTTPGRRRTSILRTRPGYDHYNQQIWLNFRHHPQPFEVLSLNQVLTKQFRPEQVRDRIVIIGNVVISSKDTFLTAGRKTTLWGEAVDYPQTGIPFSFGLEIHAHTISHIVSRVLDNRQGIWSLPLFIEYLLIIAAGVLGTVLGLVLASPWGRLLGLGGLSAALILLCYASLTLLGLWLPLLPGLMALLGTGCATLLVDRKLLAKLIQSQATLEWASTTVHNGPLQHLAAIMRDPIVNDKLYQQLSLVNQDLRTIHQSLEAEIIRGGCQFRLGGARLDASLPLPQLLKQVHQLTIDRQFPGFESIRLVMTPQLAPLANCPLTIEQKKMLCIFLEEALCNVGKHACQANRLDVIGRVITEMPSGKRAKRASKLKPSEQPKSKPQYYCLQVIDNGETPIHGFVVRRPRRWPWKRARQVTLPTSKYKSQGTRQMEAIARQFGGTFERFPQEALSLQSQDSDVRNGSQGTCCQLTWPTRPPLGLRLRHWLRRL